MFMQWRVRREICNFKVYFRYKKIVVHTVFPGKWFESSSSARNAAPWRLQSQHQNQSEQPSLQQVFIKSTSLFYRFSLHSVCTCELELPSRNMFTFIQTVKECNWQLFLQNSHIKAAFCLQVIVKCRFPMELFKWNHHSVPYRENLPGHFKFKEYCPQVFRNLRERFGIEDLDYQVTWCALHPLIER